MKRIMNVAGAVKAEKLNKVWFILTNKIFLNQCLNTTVLPLVMKNGKALPCLSTLQKWQEALATNRKQKDSRHITETVPSQQMTLSQKVWWLNMKRIFEIRAISCPNNYCIKTTVILVEGWQVKYLTDDSLTILQFFCCCTFLPLFPALIKLNSKTLTQASKVQFPRYVTCLTY